MNATNYTVTQTADGLWIVEWVYELDGEIYSRVFGSQVAAEAWAAEHC